MGGQTLLITVFKTKLAPETKLFRWWNTPTLEHVNPGTTYENRYVCPIMAWDVHTPHPTYLQPRNRLQPSFSTQHQHVGRYRSHPLNEHGKSDQIAGRVPNNITIICLYSIPNCLQPRNHLHCLQPRNH